MKNDDAIEIAQAKLIDEVNKEMRDLDKEILENKKGYNDKLSFMYSANTSAMSMFDCLVNVINQRLLPIFTSGSNEEKLSTVAEYNRRYQWTLQLLYGYWDSWKTDSDEYILFYAYQIWSKCHSLQKYYTGEVGYF